MKVELIEETEINGDIFYAIYVDGSRIKGFYGGDITSTDLSMRQKAQKDAQDKYEDFIKKCLPPSKSTRILNSIDL